ncbi:thioesterase II family protein [Streptomyces silvensis]|uniref:thioesterase II family protein n=1 Tax=Streptomyces silvensis TaxID=1765722 RepID=UPI0007C6354B|nr:thioesterase domain-containing protein [Streptomyces silvensis]
MSAGTGRDGPNPWVVRSGAARDSCRIRLVCFPHAGAGASVYRPWITALAPEVEVLPLVLPGRDSRWREPAHTGMSGLARAAAEGLAAFFGAEERQVPYAFFGHSLGAVVAYETARALGRPGPGPQLLVVSASAPPARAAASSRGCHTLPDEEFLAEVDRLGGLSPGVLGEAELLRLLLPVLRADFTLAETYAPAPGPPLSCPVAVYAGRDDTGVREAHLAQWQEVTEVRPVVRRTFPGGHFYLDGARPDLVHALRQDLGAAAEPVRAGGTAPRPVPHPAGPKEFS